MAHLRVLVQPRQQEEILDEVTHRGRLALDAFRCLPRLRGGGKRALAEQLGVRADDRERGAQLVAGIGDEPAQLLLTLVALRECVLDTFEHVVEGPGE